MTSMLVRTLLSLCLLLPAVLAADSALKTAPAGGEELWYRVEVGGSPAGWMVSREIRRGDEVTTETSLRLRFKRGGEEVALELASRFAESTGGRPIAAWSRQKLGLVPIETTYEFVADGVVAESRQGDDVTRTELPAPSGDWLTPARAQAYVVDRLREGDESFEVRSIDPSLGVEPFTTRWQLEARDVQVMAQGSSHLTSRWRQSQSYSPQLSTVVHIQPDGRTIRSSTPLAGLEMTLVLSSREEVLQHRAAPELLIQTFVYPDRPIAEPRRTQRATYDVSSASGRLPRLPTVGAQRIGKRSRTTAEVIVEVGKSPRLEGKDRPDPAVYLQRSRYLDHEDPRVRRLVADALAKVGVTAAGDRAEALREFVSGYLQEKNLNTVLATAPEIAESRAGDCTEHAVLLAAMLRADGIPSRVANGLVYSSGFAGRSDFFAYHMWVQALIDDRWVDLDATLDVPFDAAHITLATSPLNNDKAALGDMAAIAPWIGNIRIKVRTTATDADAPANDP